MVRYASLVATNIMFNHDRKLGIQVGNCCFLLHMVGFVSYSPVKHSLCFNNLNNVRFSFVIAWFLGELWSDMHRWWSRISWTNHDRKLGIQVGNCCVLLHVVRFVSYAPVKHSSCFNNINNVRFRFVIEWFLEELWSDMHRWWSRKSCTTTTKNSESKLEIVVSCCTW
jgi:hypothetical protein